MTTNRTGKMGHARYYSVVSPVQDHYTLVIQSPSSFYLLPPR